VIRGGVLVLAAALVVFHGGAASEAQRQPGWEVRISERIELAPGASGALAISIAVDRGLTVSKDAAVIVDLSAPAGITIRKRRIGRGEAVDPEADAPRFAVPVRANEIGEHTVKVRARFWLCGGRSCRPIDVRRTAVVVVAAPPPPVDAGVDVPANGPADAR
jgi:hypothetical protein